MSAGQLMVLEIELSTWRCRAACISRCARGASSSARHESLGQRRIGAEALAEEARRHSPPRSPGASLPSRSQHAPLVAEVEHRLDAARHVAGEERDGAGRRDRGEQPVADAVRGDRGAHLLGQAPHVGRRQKLLRVEQREGALLARQLGAGEIGGRSMAAIQRLGQRDGLGRAVAHAAQDQRIGEAGDAEADAALGLRLLPSARAAG